MPLSTTAKVFAPRLSKIISVTAKAFSSWKASISRLKIGEARAGLYGDMKHYHDHKHYRIILGKSYQFKKRRVEKREELHSLFLDIRNLQSYNPEPTRHHEPVTLIVEATLGTPFLSITNNIQYPGSTTPGSLGTWKEYVFLPALLSVRGMRR